jgi:hypothetical protein
MSPEKDSCLVEVLDRLLNRGAVLNADLIISVAGIPMIGLNLRAIIASMETMLDYGMMEAWDRNTREWYSSNESERQSRLSENDYEETLFKAFGYLWQDRGIISNWLPGIWHVTTKRLFLRAGTPGDVIFEVPLHDISIVRETPSDERSLADRIELDITYAAGAFRIYLSDMAEFIDALQGALSSQKMVEA